MWTYSVKTIQGIKVFVGASHCNASHFLIGDLCESFAKCLDVSMLEVTPIDWATMAKTDT